VVPVVPVEGFFYKVGKGLIHCGTVAYVLSILYNKESTTNTNGIFPLELLILKQFVA